MRRPLALTMAVLGTALVLLSTPAHATDTTPLDTKPDKTAVVAALGLPDVDVAVSLQCGGRVGDDGPVVACAWRTRSPVAITAWQLWRVRIRPPADGRVLVTEVGPDETSHVDTTVTWPAAYLYAVVGIDARGEIVARSRPDLAVVVGRDHGVIHLGCNVTRSAVDRVIDAHPPAVACRWQPADDAGIRGYVVHRSVDGGPREVLAELGADETSIVDHDVATGHRYSYVVSGVDADGDVVAHSRIATVGIPPDHRDRVVDRVTDRATDAVVDRVTDRATDAAVDRVTDRATDAVVDRETDRVTDREGDHDRAAADH